MIYKNIVHNQNIHDLENTFLLNDYIDDSNNQFNNDESINFFLNLSENIKLHNLSNINILIEEFMETKLNEYYNEFYDLDLHNLIFHEIVTSDDPLFLISIFKFLGKLVTIDIKYCKILVDAGYIQITMNVLNEISSVELQICILRFIRNLASTSNQIKNMVLMIFPCQNLNVFALDYHELIPEVLKTYYTYLMNNNDINLVKEIMYLILDFFKFKNKDNMICLIFLLYQFTKFPKLLIDYYMKEKLIQNFIHNIIKFDKSKSRKSLILYVLTSIYDIIPIQDENLFLDVSMLLCDENENILINTSELICKFIDNKNSIINEKYIPGILFKLLSNSKNNTFTIKVSSSSTLLSILILYPQYTTMLIKDGLMELIIDVLDMEIQIITSKAIFYLSSIFEQEKQSCETNLFNLFMELDGMESIFSLLNSPDSTIVNYSKNFILSFGVEIDEEQPT